MKKLSALLLSVIMSLTLMACSDTVAEESTPKKQATPAEQKDVEKDVEPKKEEPQTTKSGDAKQGDIVERDGVKVKVVKKQDMNQVIDMNPIKITVAGVQVIDVLEVEDADIAGFMDYVEGEPFRYIRIDYTVENTSDNNVQINSPFRDIILSTGEQIDASMDNMIWEETGGDFFGKSHKNNLAIAVPFKSDPSKVESFRVITGTVDDMEFNVIVDSKEANFQFK